MKRGKWCLVWTWFEDFERTMVYEEIPLEIDDSKSDDEVVAIARVQWDEFVAEAKADQEGRGKTWDDPEIGSLYAPTDLCVVYKIELAELIVGSNTRSFNEFGGSTPEDLRDFLNNSNRVSESVGAKSAFDRSFTDLLAACRQDWVNSDFNEKNFPLEPIADDEAGWEVCEHHFGRAVNGSEAFKELVENPDYRLCGPRRAMEYISNGHLNDQLDHPLIVTAIGGHRPSEPWKAFDHRPYVPVFLGDCDGRILRVCYLDSGFKLSSGWLVLRKRS